MEPQATTPLTTLSDGLAATTQLQDSRELLFTLSENTIYLMGFSFVLGSLFTILMLIILDFMRRHSGDNHADQ